MLAEIITESNIPDKELEIYLTNKRQEYLVNLEKTSYLAKQKFSALIFGEDHPYANRIEESDYQRITVSLIRDFYHRYYQAGQFRIFICGHVNEGLLNTVTRLFGNLPIPSPGNISKKLPFHAAQPGRYHVSKENCVQSSIRIGKSSVRLTDDDYAGYMLLNTILGGYFGSRLMSNIREEKGYTYGIGSFNVSLPQRSYWSITTEVNNEYTEATIEEIFKEIHKLRTETVPAEELNLVKNYLYGDLLRELDGVFAQSDSLKHKLNYGLDNSFYIGIIEKIRQCTPEAILELADKYWNPEEMYIVTMKKLIFISLLFSILSLSVSAQKPTKAEKAAQLEQEFQQTRQLIESNHFQFELNRVYPQGGQDLSRFNPRGKFVITDSVAKGTLPFFGRAYSLPYGEGGGIEFDGVMKDQSLKIEHKKKRKILIYRFSITAKNDTYQISMEISGGGNCSVNLNSNNRAQISYSGTVSPVKDETGKS